MAAVLESVVGHWGSIFISVGVLVSVLGAYLAWTLMSAEVLYIPAKTEDMPRFLARTNKHGAPVAALMMAAGLISVLLVALLFAADALDFMLDLTARTVADTVSPRGRLRAEADRNPRDLRRPQVARSRHGDRGGCDDLHVVPDLRGGIRQAPVVVHPVRARRHALRQGPARTQSAGVQPRRSCSCSPSS